MKEKLDLELEMQTGNDDFLYADGNDEKGGAPYAAATRAVVLGSVSIVIALFGLLFYTLGSITMPLLLLAAAIIISVVGLVSANKGKKTLSGTLCEGMARAGKTVSTLGLIVSALALAYVVAMILLSFVVVALMVVGYVILYAFAIFAMVESGQYEFYI